MPGWSSFTVGAVRACIANGDTFGKVFLVRGDLFFTFPPMPFEEFILTGPHQPLPSKPSQSIVALSKGNNRYGGKSAKNNVKRA
jgi:hypothetical protein